MKAVFIVLAALFITSEDKPTVYIVPIHGAIDHSNRAFLRRVATKIKNDKPSLVIFEISTPGGDGQSMLAMSDEILSLNESGIKTCAFITSSKGQEEWQADTAASAGSLIAMSCNKIYMRETATIGAAQPVYITGEGMKAANRKVINFMSSKFAAVARKNGYPANLAIAMVDPDIEVLRVVTYEEANPEKSQKIQFLTRNEIEQLRQNKIKIKGETIIQEEGKGPLSLEAQKAVEFGLATIASSRNDIYKAENITDPVETSEKMTWSENFVEIITNPAVSSILLMIGFLAIYMEFRSPGIGYPAVIAIICLGTVLFGHHLAGLAEAPQILLVVAGLVLIAVEFFVIPGTMIPAILGIGLVLTSFIMSFGGFTFPNIGNPIHLDSFLNATLRVLVPFLVATFLFMLIIKIMPGVPLLNKMVLQTELAGGSEIGDQLKALVSKNGIAVSTLRPAGKIEIDNVQYDAISTGDYIEKGNKITVISIDENKIIVKKLDE